MIWSTSLQTKYSLEFVDLSNLLDLAEEIALLAGKPGPHIGSKSIQLVTCDTFFRSESRFKVFF